MARPDIRRVFRLDRGRRGVAARVDEEMEFHLARRAEELVAQGMSPNHAREEALRAYGDVARFRRELTALGEARATRLGVAEWIAGVAGDVRLAARSLRRDPVFTAMALLTLAVGIGATTAVFSVVDGVLLRPLPYPHAERLVRLEELNEKGSPMDWAGANFNEARLHSRAMASMAAYSGGQTTALGADEPVRAMAYAVSGEFFDVFGVPAALGRTFTPEERVAGGPPAVVVSHGFWERALGGDSAFDRRTLRMQGKAYRVVGVMPRGFAYPADAELWGVEVDENPYRTAHNWRGVGRVGPGYSFEQARGELSSILADIRRREGASGGDGSGSDAVGVYLNGLHDELAADSRQSLLVLQGAVAFVLLLACANLTNANLARGETRQRELAVRAALGAGRARLARLLLTESLLLSLVGGLLGLALAWWLTRFAATAVGTSLPGFARLRIDGGVVAFASAVTVATGLAIGLLPARSAAHTDLRGAMSDGGQSTASGGRLRARSALVMAEVALALTLLVGAGLLVRSMSALLAVDPGFAVDRVVTAGLSLPAERYPDTTSVAAFYDALLPRVAAIPGVSSAGVTSVPPLDELDPNSQFYVDGGSRLVGSAGYRVVSADYFRAMGIPLRNGRQLGAEDRPGAPHAVVVNESAVRRFWPNESPIGHRVRFPGMDKHAAEWLTIVGVVGDVRHRGLDERPRPEMFVAYRQRPERLSPRGTIVVRGSTSPDMLSTALRGVIRAADPAVAVSLSSMRAALDRSVAPRRFTTSVLAGFGALALFLAAVGIYGVLAFSVARRRRELSVRLALGGQPSDLRRMVVRDALRAVIPGMAIGAALSLLLARSLRAVVYGVSAVDPASFTAVSVLLLVVALLAAYLPARTATRVDPLLAIRGD